MCDLVSAFTVGSAVLGAVGQKKAANANAAQSKMDAQVARENAALVDLKIKDAIYRGKRTERDVRREGAQAVGSQRAATGANNLDLNFGSPLDMIYETFRLMNEDIDTTKRNTASEITDLEQEKLNFGRSASGSDAAAKAYKTGGSLAAFGSILSGGAGVASYRASIV